jgi:predicted ATPase
VPHRVRKWPQGVEYALRQIFECRAVPHGGQPQARSHASIRTLTRYASVRLFIARAQAVKPDFSVTDANAPWLAQVCHRLDGLPLAIELAAAQVRDVGLEQIALRLNQPFSMLTRGSRLAPVRQRTLKATFDWSYGVLNESERVMLNRLAIFPPRVVVGGR